MHVDAAGHDEQGIGLALLHLRQEALDVAAALDKEVTVYRAVDGMLDDDVEHGAAVVDDSLQLFSMAVAS